jgi:hypothetical protein
MSFYQDLNSLGVSELSFKETTEVVGGENAAAWSLGYMVGTFLGYTERIMEKMLF